jgi:hypothetical protein
MATMSIPDFTAVLMASVRAQLRGGYTNTAVLPDNVPEEVLLHVADEINKELKTKYITVYNSEKHIVALCPLAEVEAKNQIDATGARIPRPPNAFIIYRATQHRVLKARFPGISNSEICKLFEVKR